MKTNQKITTTISLLTCASALLACTSAEAVEYHVDVNTSSLVGNANAPFYLDFQLNYGSGPFSNGALIQNFTGVAPTLGSPTLSGTAAGDLNTAVSLTDNSASPLNEFYQAFTPGSHLGFDVYLSQNQTLLTPDSLQFAILDNTANQIPTTQPGVGLSLAEFDINANGSITANAFAGANDPVLGNYSGVNVTVTPVPEPSIPLLGFGAAGLVFWQAFRGRKPASTPA